MRWPFRRSNPFAGRNFLDLVPARLVQDVPGDDAGRVVLLVARFRDPVGRRLLQSRLPESRRWIRVQLDARGARIWREIDGRRPIRDLIPTFAAAFPEDADDIPTRLSQWFYAAYENGLIKFLNL